MTSSLRISYHPNSGVGTIADSEMGGRRLLNALSYLQFERVAKTLLRVNLVGFAKWPKRIVLKMFCIPKSCIFANIGLFDSKIPWLLETSWPISLVRYGLLLSQFFGSS